MSTYLTKRRSNTNSCRLRFTTFFIVAILSTQLWALGTNSYNNISNEDDLQAVLDELYTLYSEEPIELKIADSGITLTKRILVRKNCNAIISGGEISVKAGYSESSIFYVTNANLTFKNICFNLSNANLLQTCFSVMSNGVLTIGEGVVYKNVDANIVKNVISSAFYQIYGGSLRVESGQLPKLNGNVIYNSKGYNTESGKVSLHGNNFFQQGRIYNATDCIVQIEGKLQNEITFEGSWLGYKLHEPFIISGNYQMTLSDFNLMSFNWLTPESSGRMAYFDSENHCVKLKLYEGSMTVDNLQARLDEIAQKHLSRNNFETIYLPEEGVLVDEPLYVRNGCQAMLKGGPLRISPNIGAHYCVMIDNNSFLYLGGITVDMMDNDFHINSGIFYNQGELRIGNPVYEWDVLFTNVPSSRGNYGESLFYIGAGATLYYDNPGLLKTGDVSIIKAGDMAEVNIWDGELESVGVPTIDGTGRINLGTTVNGSNPDGSIINAKEYWSIESKETIKDLSGASTYISAEKIYFSYPGNPLFEGNGKNIVIGEYGIVNGNTPVPMLYLKKDAFISARGTMKVEWILDASWGDFTLEKVVVENVLSQDDFEMMTFINMPANREAYYDENSKTVKLRELELCDADDLLRFIEDLSGTTTTNDNPAEATLCDEPTIDQDVDIEDDLWLYLYGDDNATPPVMNFYGGAINLKSRNSGWTFKGVGFTCKNEATAPMRAAGNPGGITSMGTLTFDGCTMKEGNYAVQNLSDGRMYLSGGTMVEGYGNLVNSGNVYLDGSVKVADLVNKKGGRIYVTSALTKDLKVSIATAADVEQGVAIILGGNGYTMTAADVSHITLTLPDGFEWKYDEAVGGIVVYSTTGITVTEQQKTVVESYDVTGREVSKNAKGLRIQRMNDGTMKKVITN